MESRLMNRMDKQIHKKKENTEKEKHRQKFGSKHGATTWEVKQNVRVGMGKMDDEVDKPIAKSNGLRQRH